MAGNSSAGFAIRSYCRVSVVMAAQFISSTDRVSLDSGISLVMSSNVFSGSAAVPARSKLEGISA